MDFRRGIDRLNISTDQKLRLFMKLRRLGWRYKYSKKEYMRLCETQSFVPSGSFYGHEHWLKEYCGYTETICALIEHGVYFGNDRSKDGWSVEWDVGSILTFGEYREKLLKQIYPDYYICGIGPRVLYAPMDFQYHDELSRMLDPNSKTITLYPAHSIENMEYAYDSDLFIKNALQVAKELKIKNILVSLHPTDVKKNAMQKFEGFNIIPVTGGGDDINFLPRLRAIMTISDITFSNALGTHVGYSIALGTPHIMNVSSNKIENTYNDDNEIIKNYREEQLMMSRIFNGKDPFSITKEQIEACDYYWGLHNFKSKDDLFSVLESCRKTYLKKHIT